MGPAKPTQDMEKMMELYIELQKPIYHTPINLGINAFKRTVKEVTSSKHLQRKLTKAFKRRGWMEYMSIARYRGNFPTHPHYGESLEVTEEKSEFKVKVKNGK